MTVLHTFISASSTLEWSKGGGTVQDWTCGQNCTYLCDYHVCGIILAGYMKAQYITRTHLIVHFVTDDVITWCTCWSSKQYRYAFVTQLEDTLSLIFKPRISICSKYVFAPRGRHRRSNPTRACARIYILWWSPGQHLRLNHFFWVCIEYYCSKRW